MDRFNHKFSRGFSFPEILIVVTILVILFIFTVPMYKKYSAITQLQNTAQRLRDDLRTAKNRASTGVLSTNGYTSHWVVRVDREENVSSYDFGACPVVTDQSAVGYSSRYTYSSCPNRSDFKSVQFPSYFTLSHELAPDDVSIFFASLTGNIRIYDSQGVYVGDTIDLRLSSTEFPEITVLLRINSTGAISEEK